MNGYLGKGNKIGASTFCERVEREGNPVILHSGQLMVEIVKFLTRGLQMKRERK